MVGPNNGGRSLAAPMAIVAVAAMTYGVVTAVPKTGMATGMPEQVSTQVVDLDGATEAKIHLKLDTGELWLAGGSMAAGRIVGSSELVRGEFAHAAEHAPAIDYEVTDDGQAGRLTIASTGSNSLWSWSSSEQRWNLFVNPIVPTELTVEVGTGSAELIVGGMLLTELEISVGSGHLTLDLTGDWRSSLAATIEIGAGDVTIRTPRDTGVKVVVEQGFGTVRASELTAVNGAYVNGAHGSTASEIEIQVDQGAGYLDLSGV